MTGNIKISILRQSFLQTHSNIQLYFNLHFTFYTPSKHLYHPPVHISKWRVHKYMIVAIAYTLPLFFFHNCTLLKNLHIFLQFRICRVQDLLKMYGILWNSTFMNNNINVIHSIHSATYKLTKMLEKGMSFNIFL